MSNRPDHILASLSQLLARQLRIPTGEIDPRRAFLELGADSLVLLEISHAVERDYGVVVAPHQLFEQVTDLATLAEFVARHEVRPEVAAPAPARASAPVEARPRVEPRPVGSPAAGRGAAPADRWAPVVARQLELMSEQLRLLGAGGAAVARPVRSPAAAPPGEPARAPRSNGAPAVRPVASPAAPPAALPARSPEQQRYLADFIRRYNLRTAGSKDHAERYRDVLADRRATAGFSGETKELQYPIVGAGARGSRLWDVDGNEYIDIAMGFGVHLFGHAPGFLREAIDEQLARGAQIGPQCARAGELAERLARITGLERVTFCNSGTEAVMTALRIARAATGRTGVVMFRGSYHGHSDGTLALGRRGDSHASIPMAPGIPQGAVDDLVILDYDDPRSLDAIRAAAGRLAAVLVEPIQSRWPEIQPHGFLHQLRALTRELDIALIFDEVITGFRVHPRGAQGRFGVTADIATYGKLLGGGMPIGVVAGARRYLDRIDGGAWRFGDASHPAVETTFFAGTFSKHPLAVAAALAVLRETEARGPELYDRLEVQTARLAAGMNRVFHAADVPLALVHAGSMFRIAPRGGADRTNYLHEPLELRLLYQHLILAGIYVWEGRTGFLSTAHTDDDVDRIVAATGEAIDAMQGAGFFARSAAPAAPAPAAEAAELRRAPLSWAQEGIWLQAQLEAGTGSFNMPGGVRLRGRLRVDAIERALREVVRRHAVLRTRFAVVDGRPEQVIAPADEATIEAEIAIARIDGHGRDAVRQLAIDEARRPFDLERGPLLRACLIAVDTDEWVLLVTMHHLIGDGWSFALLVDELAALYTGYCEGAPPRLPAPTLSYADHAVRQRQHLDEAVAERQLAYWKQRLDGVPDRLALPTDRPRRDGGVGNSATLAQTVDPALVRSLHELARTTRATLHMVLLAGYAALLHRHTGQDDLAIGAPVTTRDRAELRGMLGPFVNTVVFRLAVERDKSFAELVQRARLATLGAYAHQDVPFARVVQATQPARLSGRHPLFQAWFNLEPDARASELRLPGLEVALLDDQIDTPTQLDLSLGAELRGGTLVLKWIYNEALFDRATIHHLAEQLVHLLGQVAADPAAPLARHSLVTAEAARLLPDPAAPLDQPDHAMVTDAFAHEVDRAPGHAAIVQGQRRWSYTELWRASVGLADRLARSTRRGDVVAVSGAPSFGLIAAMLGTLLDDRVLLPIDPGLPAERQAVMLREAGARCLVRAEGEEAALADLPGPAGATGLLARQPGDAYIFYTSGTTGTPRAVLGTHRGLAHFLAWQRTAFDVGAHDRVAQTTRLSFDAVLRDVFLPLTSGATLVLPEDGDLAEPDAALAWLSRQRITLLHTVPSLGQHWIAGADRRTRLSDLRRVFFSGEPLQTELVQRWRQLAPAAEVINFYGPTETTMIKCYYRVPDLPEVGVQPAGIPLPDTQALVLTPERTQCGVGEIGEIVLRTAYGTRGYLNAPDRDPQRFIANPYAHDGIALYRTGDRGRYRADGQLQILGRTDRQIKLRGVRIELAELESVLGAHPAVRQASVQLLGEPPAARLVAFLVADDGASQDDILAALRVRLPDAMIPARLVFVRELPRLPTGKVDAKALAALAAAPAATRVAPATPTQALVAAHARELLAVAELGIHDNFFELGGHSLLAAQLVARLRAALGIELGLRALFDAPTVAGLAEHIDRKPGASERALALALKTRGGDRATETIEL